MCRSYQWNVLNCQFVEYNFSHRILRLSFGDPVPGIVNTLEGEEKLTSDRESYYNNFSLDCFFHIACHVSLCSLYGQTLWDLVTCSWWDISVSSLCFDTSPRADVTWVEHACVTRIWCHAMDVWLVLNRLCIWLKTVSLLLMILGKLHNVP